MQWRCIPSCPWFLEGDNHKGVLPRRVDGKATCPVRHFKRHFQECHARHSEQEKPEFKWSASTKDLNQFRTWERKLSGKWGCKNCDFDNKPGSLACEICGAQREQKPDAGCDIEAMKRAPKMLRVLKKTEGASKSWGVVPKELLPNAKYSMKYNGIHRHATLTIGAIVDMVITPYTEVTKRQNMLEHHYRISCGGKVRYIPFADLQNDIHKEFLELLDYCVLSDAEKAKKRAAWKVSGNVGALTPAPAGPVLPMYGEPVVPPKVEPPANAAQPTGQLEQVPNIGHARR